MAALKIRQPLSGTSRKETTRTPLVDDQEVAQLAYEFYVRRGRVNGRDLEDWLKAEAIVRQGAARRKTSSR